MIRCEIPVVDSGVFPVRVTSNLGDAGYDSENGELLFTVTHSIHNITPAVGSLGGGQLVTMHGLNFPTDKTLIDVSFDVYVSTERPRFVVGLGNFT